MAKLFWAGSQATFKVSNKQTDNSGIQSITIDDGASYYISSTLSLLTNTTAGSTEDTKGNATFIAYTTSDYVTINPSIYVTWKSGGKTDSHSVGEVTLYNPVDRLDISETRSIIYTDADKYPITVLGKGQNESPIANSKTGLVNISSNILGSTVSSHLGTTDLKSEIQKTISSRFGTSGVFEPTFTVKTTYSDKPTTTTLSENEVTSSVTAGAVFTLRNATKSISVNSSTADTSIYIAAGQTREISYTVNPDVAGVAYSYELSFVESPNSNYVTVESVAPTSSAAGKFTINTDLNAAGNSTTIKLKSTASATGEVLSPTVTIYITTANTEIFINVGDVYYMAVMDAETIAAASDSSVAAAEIVGNSGAKQLKITGKNISDYTAKTSVTLSSGTVITINVAHIAVSID